MDFPCVYLEGQVQLTEERLNHILQTHPELSLIYQSVIGKTLKDYYKTCALNKATGK